MSRIPIGVSSGNKELGLGIPIPKTYFGRYEMTSQFEGAERIADKWGITREDTDAFGFALASSGPRRRGPRTASPASTSTVEAPDLDEDGKPTGTTHTVDRDEGLRETTLEKLATLKPVARRERRAHRRQLVADLRRRRGGADDDRGEGRARSASRRGPASSTPASSASTRC